MTFLNFAITTFFSIILLYLYVEFTSVFYTLQFKMLKKLIFSVVSGIIANVSLYYFALLVQNEFINAVFTIIIVFFVVIVCSTKILKLSLFKSFISQFMFVGIDAIITVVIVGMFKIFGIRTSELDTLTNIYGNILLLVINLLVIDMIRRYRRQLKINSNKLVAVNANMMLYFIASFCSLVITMSIFKDLVVFKEINKGQILLFSCIILYVIYNLISTGTYFKNLSLQDELEHQTFYNKTLESIITDTKRFKHNYGNIISSVGGYLSINDFEGLKKFYYTLEQALNEVNLDTYSLNLTKISNAGLMGLFIRKYEYSKSLEVSLQFNVNSEVNEIKIKISDLCEVLGVLIDNAIEAAACADKRLVFINIDNVDNSFSVVIENYCSIEDNKIKKAVDSQGLGLEIVRKIVNRYKNVNFFMNNNAFEDGTFITKIYVE